MPYKNLRHFIQTLESSGELIRIKEYVNPHLEITEIADRVSKSTSFSKGEGQGERQNKALLFENTGYDFPLLINAFGSEKRMCMALGVNKLDALAEQLDALFKNITSLKESFLDKLKLLPQLNEISSWMPKVIAGKGNCQEVIMQKPDITKFPVLKCWPEDGGDFLTLPVVHTKNPHNGIRNVGLYRMQVFSPTMTAMHWHRHKVSAQHFNEYKKLGIRMPVAVALGGDPVYTYCATAPLPENVDEYLLAGFIRKKKVEMVQCHTQDMQVPADADIIIEGYIDPNEEFILEGPFGDHTGYYSLTDYYPRFHITCITHRRDAVYPATIVGIPPQEDAWLGKATERIFLAPIRMTMLPEIVDMVMPVEGVFHNLVIVKIKKEYPGQAIKVMNSLWGAGQMMFTKIMVVVDGDVDIQNMEEVTKYIAENTNPATDFIFTKGPTDVLDHSCAKMAFGGKLGIDATKKHHEEIPDFKIQNPTHHAFPKKQGQKLTMYQIHELFSEIKAVNDSLLKSGIPVIFISVEKNRKEHVRELHQKLSLYEIFKGIKLIIYMEHTVDIADIADVVWRCCNNFDPQRDYLTPENSFSLPVLQGGGEGRRGAFGFDGTRKTKELDDFERDWPNILASEEATIKRIDEIWNKLGLGTFIKSPSLKYRKQLYKGGAVAEE